MHLEIRSYLSKRRQKPSTATPSFSQISTGVASTNIPQATLNGFTHPILGGNTMEPGLYFTALVITIGALHLVLRAAASIGKMLKQSGLRQNHTKRKSQKRGDWYVFFHCSDLTGPDTKLNNRLPGSGRSFTRGRKSVARRPVVRINAS